MTRTKDGRIPDPLDFFRPARAAAGWPEEALMGYFDSLARCDAARAAERQASG